MWYGKRKEEIGGEANYVSIILGCYKENLCCLFVYNKRSYKENRRNSPLVFW